MNIDRPIVFIGSSILQGWESLRGDMKDLPIVNNAVGGSGTGNMLDWIDEKVISLYPVITVFYCGSNDLNCGTKPEDIIFRTKEFHRRLIAGTPDCVMLYLSIMKAPQKHDKWDLIDEINGEFASFSEKDLTFGYIDVNPVFFKRPGEPFHELYQEDKLHLTRDAYRLFGLYLYPKIMEVYRLRKHALS